MAKDFLHLAEKVRNDEKFFDVSRDEIVRRFFEQGKIEIPTDHEVIDNETGNLEFVPLRLKVSGIQRFPEGWDIALVMHNIRIDGFGWEEEWNDIRAESKSGWHRHMWNPVAKSAKGKIATNCFDGDDLTVEQFIIRGFDVMRILLNRRDDGNSDLF